MNLWGDIMPFADGENDFVPEIEAYEAGSKGAVIIFPGGGYGMRAEHEGAGYAKWLASNGITAFVVSYRVSPYRHPAPLADAMRAVRHVLFYAEKYGIDRDKIAVMGSSAGGHLAGSVSVHYDKDIYEPTDRIDKESARPDATILCYPVIDMGYYRHEGSRNNLLGMRSKTSMQDLMSIHLQVNENTPEAFIWHTSTDEAVDVTNSLIYGQALREEDIPFEMHIYPVGKHGLGLAEDEEYVAKWSDNLMAWLKFKNWK